MRTEILRTFRRLFLAGALALPAGCDLGATPGEPQLQRARPDAANGRVWVLTADEVVLYREGQAQGTRIPLPGWIWVGERGCAPDLALGPAGEAVITSNIVPVLWRVDPQTLAVSVHTLSLDADAEKDVGFSGLVYAEEHSAYFAVSGIHGSLWRIDAALGNAEKVSLPAPLHRACGLALYPDSAKTKSKRAALCAGTRSDNWVVSLAPDLRTGQVRRAWCADRPSLPTLLVSRAP